MEPALYYPGIGLLLGLSAGFAPGPLLTLVITEALRFGVGAGLKVAIAPLLTDLPIILLSLYVLHSLSAHQAVLGIISLCGAVVVATMAIQALRSTLPEVSAEGAGARALIKGVLANALSPHPYLFWITVGGPLMRAASQVSVWSSLGFLAAFYATLVGAKVGLAIMVARSRSLLRGGHYRYAMLLLGVMLLLLALVLLVDGLQLLAWVAA